MKASRLLRLAAQKKHSRFPMRHSLVVLLSLLVLLIRVPTLAQDNEPPDCDRYETCIDLFGNNVVITEIRARSSLSVFQAPLLQVEFEVPPSVGPPPYGLYTGFRQLQRPEAVNPTPENTANPTCELVIVGLQDPQTEAYAPVIPIEQQSGSQVVSLYGFCRGMNLPGTGGRPFPTGEDDLTTNYQSGLNQPDEETRNALNTLLQRIQAETCLTSEGVPLTVGSLATQFAVFLLFAEADTGAADGMWRQFQIDAGNTVYTREQDAIYCLLDGIVTRPEPTPTPTATPSPQPPATESPIRPTATPLPLDQPIIPTGGSDISLAQFGTLIGAVFFGIVLGMVGVTSLKSRLIRRGFIVVLIVIVIVLLLWLSGFSLAQDEGVIPTPAAGSTDTPPPSDSAPAAPPSTVADTAPPPLLMIVVLDESGTMQNGTNSILPTGGTVPAGFGRLSTDPADRRLEAIIDLAARLQNDRSTTHQLAVMTFARTTENPQWLTPDGWSAFSGGIPLDIFTPLGQDVENVAFETFVNRLRQPRGWRDALSGGAGNPAPAMTLIQTAITDALRDRPTNSVKPVVLLITDDVPMDNFGTGPWAGSAAWSTYLPDFETPLLTLSATGLYQGYCAKPNGGVTVASFPMGAANWVNADGSTQEIGAPDAGTGTYFTDLATRLGAVNPVSGDLLVYPIDPLFSDAGIGQNETDFDVAITGLLRGLRCTDRIEVATTTEGLDAVGNVPVSAFHSHVTIVVDVNPDQIVEIVPPGGASLGAASNITRTELTPAGSPRKRVIFGLSRGDFSPGSWAGQWQLRTEGTQIAVSAEAVVDLSGVTVVDRTPVTSLEPGQPLDLRYEVFTNGYPVRPGDDLLASVTGSEPTIGQFPLEADGTEFTEQLDGFSEAGRYNVAVAVNINPPDTVPLTVTEVFNERLTTIDITSGFVLRRTVPDTDTLWDCDQGQQELTAIVELGSNSASAESIGSYTRIDVYYPPRSAAEDEAMPIAQLAWQEENRFVGQVDCAIFTDEDGDVIEIVAVFPNNAENTRNINFDFQPTPTPTFTPMPIETAIPTPTPAPPGPDPAGNIGESITQPPLSMILIGLAVITAGSLTIRLTTVYFRTMLPLFNVWLEEDMQPRERLLGRLRRYLPIGHQRTLLALTDDNRTISLARISGQRGGRSIQIRVLAPTGVSINGDFAPQGSTIDKRDEEIQIIYNNSRFTLINRNARY